MSPIVFNLLDQELATLNATFKDERLRNESLKRMKVIESPFFSDWPLKWLYFAEAGYLISQLDYNASKSVAHVTDQQPNKATLSAHGHGAVSSLDDGSVMLAPQVAPLNYPPSDVPGEPEPLEKQGTCFVLPDLNLMPSEDDLFL